MWELFLGYYVLFSKNPLMQSLRTGLLGYITGSITWMILVLIWAKWGYIVVGLVIFFYCFLKWLANALYEHSLNKKQELLNAAALKKEIDDYYSPKLD